jgi:hypothetical protein
MSNEGAKKIAFVLYPRLGVASLIWIASPMLAGLVRVLRKEVK